MNYISLPKQSAYTPLYSPRTTLSRHNQQLDRLTTNLSINIDKYILGFFKDAFQKNQSTLTQQEFLAVGKKQLKSWQKDLDSRELKLILCLCKLFEEIDYNNTGRISWSEFNTMLIEKGLNLKSLRNQEPSSIALLKPTHIPGYSGKHPNLIQKMINLGNKIAVFCEESNSIQFLSIWTQKNSSFNQNLKPLVLAQQQLVVETTISKRVKKSLHESGSKGSHNKKQLIKKDIVVAQYKNILLDMIYVHDQKYNMLITSSSDFVVRGWDVSTNTPTLAKQPENQDEKMKHHFQNQIYCMAWDPVNQILYCTGKSTKILEWMIKTDSERQLFDQNDGHTQMISAMVMMPKLQFLATGDYSGKIILWDTIAQTKKFDYCEHTRSISSMTFHENLILLFTSAYDHSICVWNPYIGSLIHKIVNNVNFIQVDIIPETNLLICLDAAANIKIRQINKFTLVSSFTVESQDRRLDPTCMVSTSLHKRQHSSGEKGHQEKQGKEAGVRYYFGGQYITAYEYMQTDSNILVDGCPLNMKYHSNKSSLYCPIKNHVIVWDLLIGAMKCIMRNQSPNQISAFDIFWELGLAVIGDVDGNVTLRKLESGLLVKKLYKHRSNILILLTSSSEQTTATPTITTTTTTATTNNNKGYLHQMATSTEKYIFSASYDGEICIFQRNNHDNQFVMARNINIKKTNHHATVTAMSYQSDRNILVIGTNVGEVYFLDVDKNKIISTCTSKAGEISALVQIPTINVLLCFSRKAQIFGVYLPPHSKKFKPSCHLISEQHTKITAIAMSKANSRCYLGSENGDLMSFYLSQTILTDNLHNLKHQQKIAQEHPVQQITNVANTTVNSNKAGNNASIHNIYNSGDTINSIGNFSNQNLSVGNAMATNHGSNSNHHLSKSNNISNNHSNTNSNPTKIESSQNNGKIQINQNNGSNSNSIKFSWKVSLGDCIKSMTLIENETIICAIVSQSIYLIRCDNGEMIGQLANYKNSNISSYEEKGNWNENGSISPILYLNDSELSVYIKPYELQFPISCSTVDEQIRRVCDPNYYLKEIDKHQITIAEKHNYQPLQLKSNLHWKFMPNIAPLVEDHVQKVSNAMAKLQLFQNKPHMQHIHSDAKHIHSNPDTKHIQSNADKQIHSNVDLIKTNPPFDLGPVIQLQKKWEQNKQQAENPKLSSTMMKSWIKIKGSKNSMSLHHLKQGKYHEIQSKDNQGNSNKYLENTSALFRLGNALRSLDEKDVKALKFVEMAEKEKKKQMLKLPKLSKKEL